MTTGTQKKKILTVLGCVIGFILVISAAVYIGISIHYKGYFYNGTTINGIDVSGYSVEDVKMVIRAGVNDYVLEIETRGSEPVKIKGKDIDLAPVWDSSLDEFLEAQTGFAWIGAAKNPKSYTSETMISFDHDKLTGILDGCAFMQQENQTEPKNAAISDYIAGVGYEIVPAKQGTALDKAILYEAIENAVYGLDERIVAEETDCYHEPAVLDDDEDLNRRLNNLNQLCRAKINYVVGEDEWTLDADTYHEWFVISEDGEVSLDESLVRKYAVDLGHKYNTCYGNREFMTSYGVTVTVGNSRYGWKVDYDAEQAQIIDEITNGIQETRDLNYVMTANSHTGPDYGNSYVEINLTAQHLFLYKDGELITECDFVSGNLAKGYGTPTGFFGLTYKDYDATLSGTGYSSHVDYWMPFNGNIGMHDATWRSTFGAAIYMRKGSHGCINMPHSIAEKVFEVVDTNYPVVVYELPGSESPAGKAQIAAYDVIDLIDEIKTVTTESEKAIQAARDAYDTLNDKGKGYVTNYKVLTDAEKAFEKLSEEEAASEKESKDEEVKEKKTKKNEEKKDSTDSSEKEE